MDQKKTGEFLKQLRKEKSLTQEQLAEQFFVSGRTVSRWETGSNMPDLSVLVELADYYDVDIREIIDGERKSEKMDKELKDTVLKIAEYSNEDKLKVTKRMHLLFIGGLIAAVIYMMLVFADRADNFLGGMCLGITFGMMIVGVIMTSKYAAKIREIKANLLKKVITK
ncbi:MAG: helix-turn-helix domain-containing protein [Clostridia bacterium]|nr:helix-turn-helix domain-containing protein [Clostridia bacterium]